MAQKEINCIHYATHNGSKKLTIHYATHNGSRKSTVFTMHLIILAQRLTVFTMLLIMAERS